MSKSDKHLCRNCKETQISIKSKNERLCDLCLKTLSRVICQYCNLDFHLLAKSSHTTPHTCNDCYKSECIYGQPNLCTYCSLRAAFTVYNGILLCKNCANSAQKYGEPVYCQNCNKKCAFNKDKSEKLAKVDNLILCVLCTRQYKLSKHKRETGNDNNNNSDKHIDLELENTQSLITIKEQETKIEGLVSKLKESEFKIHFLEEQLESVSDNSYISKLESDNLLYKKSLSDKIEEVRELKNKLAHKFID